MIVEAMVLPLYHPYVRPQSAAETRCVTEKDGGLKKAKALEKDGMAATQPRTQDHDRVPV